MSRYSGEGHPWADFLNARARVLEMWRLEGKTPEECVRTLAMDPVQVRLILMTVAGHPEEYPVATTPPEAPSGGTVCVCPFPRVWRPRCTYDCETCRTAEREALAGATPRGRRR